MPENFYMYFLVAAIPMVIGAVYYHPKVVGGAWMKTNNFTEESLQGANMAVIFGVSYLFALMFSFFFTNLAIHQTNLYGLLMPEIQDVSSAAHADLTDFMAKYGDRHRTFSHGAVHGVIAAIFFALPILGINALFERRGGKYILIHFGYWLITLALMGGTLCATLKFGPIV